MERKKLELEINKPTHIKLLFDSPIVGESQYGKYYLYAVSNGSGIEYSLFAPSEVHETLKELKKGDNAIITKIAAQRGKKLVTTFDVKVVESEKEVNSSVHNPDTTQTNPQNSSYYDAMGKSLEEASRLTQKYGGLSISAIAISMFIQRSKS